MPKIMRIYYDNAGYPYKDSALSVRYPIVEGNEFTGANNTTEVHFYTNNLSAGATWVANCKLPNSELVNRLLIPTVDDQGIVYQKLLLDRELTNFQGHLKIGLNGYAGNISIDEEELDENNIVVISGTPTIIATGIVDIAMNYNPVIIPLSDLTTTEYEQLLAIIGSKLDITKGIYVVEDIVNENYLNYALGQILYDKESKLFYRRANAGFILENIDIGSLTVNGETLSNLLAGIVYEDELDNYYTKTEVDNIANQKVDKTNASNKVYGTDEYGNQTTIDVDDPLVGEGSIVRRVGSGGQVIVGNPQATNHATPKSYVDNEIQTTVSYVDTEVQGAKDYAKDYADTLFTSTLKYKGSKTVAELNALNLGADDTGNFYNVTDSGVLTIGNLEVLAGDNVAWTGNSWDKLTMDLSVYDDKFIAAGFFEVEDYDEENGTITLVYASDLYDMSYSESTGILTIEAN